MNEKQMNLRQLADKYQENCGKIKAIADKCQTEKRERSDAETVEYEQIVRENQWLEMQMRAATADYLKQNPNAVQDAEKMLRENAASGRKSEILLVRDMMMVSDVTNRGLIPLNIQDFIKPLVEGFILDKVGIPMPTGLAGDYVWPMYEMVEATVLNEGVALTDTKIPLSKMTAVPARVGIAIPVTNQTIAQTNGLIEKLVREVMPAAVRQLLNKILFSTKEVNSIAKAAGLVGPFVEAKNTAVKLSAVPTYKELNEAMKAKVLESGVDGEHLCWVMTKSMEAILEGTPINEKGIFVPMIQNHVLCGLPVYTTNAIRDVKVEYQKYSDSAWHAHSYKPESETIKHHVSGKDAKTALATISAPTTGDIAEIKIITEHIGLGDWRYQPMGLFGTIRFTVDPYSKARQDSVDFVLNCDYSTKTLEPAAFKIGEVAKV